MNQLVLIIGMLFLGQSAFSSQSYIVKLKSGVAPATFALRNDVTLKQLVPGMNLYKATPNNSRSATVTIASRQDTVDFAQPNHPVTLRSNRGGPSELLPNDKSFDLQWGFGFDNSTIYGINAPAAWAVYGTGGNDAAGNEIVVAIVDGGFDITHPDLVHNLWVNKGEIADNSIDDDGNGYVDDINGWDVDTDTGTIQTDYHGTHVSGTIGAEGNNGVNGTGVNWRIKLMFVSAGWGLGETTETMAAYGYILKQKELWVKSGGKEGANVVAVNSSFGIDQADCNSPEFAAWNDMFEELGKVGILSVAATANSNWNIDDVGDVPTACESEYVVSVTNSEMNGEKSSDAGYGHLTIDLAAPGTNIESTYPNNDFGPNSGTSMATPHVAGTIGYLYSAASPVFIDDAMANPGAAALALKAMMLETVTTRSSMTGKTVSGGIVNLYGASQRISDYTRTIPILPGKFLSKKLPIKTVPKARMANNNLAKYN